MWVSDAEYLYQKDIQEKKSIGKGIYHKKGSKSKKCNFPSDYMTKKEKEKMNSALYTWDLNKFYTYAEFKDMPDDIQLEYLNKLIDTYGITSSNIAKELFNMSVNGFWQYCKKHGYSNRIHQNHDRKNLKKNVDKFQTAILQAMDGEHSMPESNLSLPELPLMPDDFTKPINADIDNSAPIEETQKKSPAGIWFGDLKCTTITMHGFDYSTLEFLANRYAGQEIEVKIEITPISNS